MKITNMFNLPEELVVYAQLCSKKREYDPSKKISVTTLMNPPKTVQLLHRHHDELVQDASEFAARLLGTNLHGNLEAAVNTINEMEAEKVLKVPFMDTLLSGRLDTYDKVTETIRDYKTCSTWSYAFEKDGKHEWKEQLNVYYYMCKILGISVKNLQIISFYKDFSIGKSAMENGAMFDFKTKELQDWVKSKIKSDKRFVMTTPYPLSPILTIDIPIWDIKDTEKYLKERVDLHIKAHNIKNEDDIPICTPEERWAKDSAFAVKKKGQKNALRGGAKLRTRMEAEKFIENHPDKASGDLYIEDRPGIDTRCCNYCLGNKFCNYYKERYM